MRSLGVLGLYLVGERRLHLAVHEHIQAGRRIATLPRSRGLNTSRGSEDALIEVSIALRSCSETGRTAYVSKAEHQ